MNADEVVQLTVVHYPGNCFSRVTQFLQTFLLIQERGHIKNFFVKGGLPFIKHQKNDKYKIWKYLAYNMDLPDSMV